MSLNPALYEFLQDTITLEAPSSSTVAQDFTFGAAVTYRAQVLPYVERVVNREGREVRSTARVVIPDRLAIDPRSRLTLPTGFTPSQPGIIAVRPLRFMDLDCTEILL